ncbi:MAG: M1 family aminopeptidase [Bacteroidia bacterium]
MKKSLILILFASVLVQSCKEFRGTAKNNREKNTVAVNLDTVKTKPKVPEPLVYRAAATRYNDLVHTKLDVRFDYDKCYLFGKASITAHPHFYPQNTLILDARGMELQEVALLEGNNHKKLQYTYANDVITILLDKEYKKDQNFTVFIEYIAKPNEIKSGGSSAISNDKGLYFINPLGKDKNKPVQVWTQGETQSNSVWFPTIDRTNQRQTDEIFMTVPNKYVTLSNGNLISSTENADGTRTDYWNMKLPHAPYLVMMAVGNFSVVKDKWRDREVNYYVEPEFARYAKAIFGNTPEMMECFSKKLGVDFAWPKYSQIVVRDYVSGAMENTSATLHGEFLQQTERELLDRDNEAVISHELFHQWFGDLVTCESWSNLPLNESFATYGEYIWEEYKRGRDAADMHGYLNNSVYLRESKSGKDLNLIRFQYDDKEDMFDAHSYQKGGAVLHMLRKYVGDEAFFASLRYYLETNKFTPVEIHHLRLAFEHVTGEDLNWFFNQWFLNPGHPDLDIKYAYDETGKKETVTITQTQDFTRFALFRIPMMVDIYAGGKTERKMITVTKASEDFVFECAAKPELVNVDAEKMLLCTKKDNHTVEEWIYMYSNAPLYLDRLEAIQALSKNASVAGAKPTLLKAMDDKFWKIRETAMRSLDGKMENDATFRQKLINIAGKDEKAEVRVNALEVLMKNFPKDESLLAVYKNGLKDQSYGVIGECLNGIVKQNSAMGLNEAKAFRDETSTYILSPLCSIYSNYGSDEDLSFYQHIAPLYRSWDQTTFLGSLGTFLRDRCKDETVVKGMPLLVDMTRNSANKYVKYYGFSALNGLLNHYQDLQDKTQHRIDELKTVANGTSGDPKTGEGKTKRSKTTEPVVDEATRTKAMADEKVLEDRLTGYKEMTRIINDGIATVKKHDDAE